MCEILGVAGQIRNQAARVVSTLKIIIKINVNV